MILESADTLRAIGWYLIAQHGEATVRVRSGMALGQDAAGELSLKPKEPLVEFALADDGGLLLTAVSSIYELQLAQEPERMRSLHLAPESPAQIAFLNNVLAIDPDHEEGDERINPQRSQMDADRILYIMKSNLSLSAFGKNQIYFWTR